MSLIASRGWNTWVSYEPALGPVDWSEWCFIKWLVSGGESDMDGKSARPSHPDWHRAARDFCFSINAPYHFKQWGSFAPVLTGDTNDMIRVDKRMAGALLDGSEWRGMPI